MPAASANLGQLRYIKETTPGVTPTTGNGVELRTLQPTMKAAIATIKSAEINKYRMVRSSTNSDLNVDGGFEFELSAKEYDPFIQGILFGTFTHYGTGGVGTTFSATITANKITAAAAPAGTSAFTTLAKGSWFKLIPPSGASAAQKQYFAAAWFKVDDTVAPTATEITLSASTPVSAAGQVTATAGFAVSQSTVANSLSVTPPSYTLEWDQADINQRLVYRGMMPNTMSLSLDVGAIIKGSFGFMGMSHSLSPTTVLPGSPVASHSLDVMNAVTNTGLLMASGKNLLASTDFIKSLKFDINNNLRGQKAIGYFGNAGVGVGELSVSGTIEAYFQNADLYNQWLNSTTTSVVFGMSDNEGNGYLIEMDRIKYRDGGLNGIQKDQDVMVSLPFDAFYDSTTGRGIRITRAVAAA